MRTINILTLSTTLITTFFLQIPQPLLAQVFTPCPFSPKPDTQTLEPKGARIIRVKQILPVGDMMTLVLTTDNNQIIKNNDGSTPTAKCTILEATKGVSIPIFPTVNGKIVKDITQTHSSPNIPSGTLQLAAFQNNNLGGLEPVGISEWLTDNSFVGSNSLTVPDFIASSTDLYYAVDLSVWSSSGFPVYETLFGTQFNIINGTSVALPGFLFSNIPLSYINNGNGWETTSLFSGTVTLDSLHALEASTVPEPSTILSLLALGTLGAASTLKRQIKSSKPSEKETTKVG
jgi:hypothetical protein